MKVLVLGSDGFFGRNVLRVISTSHEVVEATQLAGDPDGKYSIDLTDRASIASVLKRVKPEAIVNCAGIVENTEKANLNAIFTTNLLEEVVASGLTFKRIIISGSASEYGIVDPADLPIKENAPLNAAGPYALSKLRETTAALEFRDKYHLPIVVARVFNPIGIGMGPRFLISGLIRQVGEIREGTRQEIEVNRLDSKRDCLDIQDVALAVKAILEHEPKEAVYNIGSGRSTSNGELVGLILNHSRLSTRPQIVETSDKPEAVVAIQADITRMTTEFGWKPLHTIDETVKGIIDASN